MFFARTLVERKPFASSRTLAHVSALALAQAIAAPTNAGMMASGPTLNIGHTTVSFPGGAIPPGVPTNASGGVSSDGYFAKFTALAGPMTRDAFLLNAPNGLRFFFDGDIVGDIPPGTRICVKYAIAVSFTGGKVNFGVATDVFAPSGGIFHANQNGQLLDDAVLEREYEYEFVEDNMSDGTFRIEANFNWVSAHPTDTLTVEVLSASVEVCSVIPSAGPGTVLAMAAVGLAARRRRRGAEVLN